MAISNLNMGVASTAVQLLNITGATNATPIVVTLPSGHGLKNGDRIAVAGITGNTGANGEWALGAVGATTATLLGSVGNGTYGGTPRVGILCDATPFMQRHNALLKLGGNFAGVVDFEAYANFADFAAGQNNFGAEAPVTNGSQVTNSAGSASTPAKSTLTMAATNDGIFLECKMPRILRTVITTATSGTLTAHLAS